jgi:hypothetical protein
MITNISVAKSSLRPSKDHARHLNILRLVGMRALVELQRREPMLPIDDQKVFLRLLQAANPAVIVRTRRSAASAA